MLDWLLKRRQTLKARLQESVPSPAPAPSAPSDGPTADALMRQAFALHKDNRVEEAEALYRQILELDPDYADAHYLLGQLALDRGDVDEGFARTLQAIRCNDGVPAFHKSLGELLITVGRAAEAIAPLKKALELDSEDAQTHTNLGHCYEQFDRVDEAVPHCEAAYRLAPQLAPVINNLAQSLRYRGRHAESTQLFEAACLAAPTEPDYYSNYLYGLNFSTDATPAQIFAAHRGFESRYCASVKPLPQRAPGGRPLRIGLLSPDLRRHPVQVFIEPLLRHYDRDRLAIHCFHLWPQEDAVSASMKSLATQWTACASMPDDDIARHIEAQGIDILIDLAGHTAGNRTRVLAFQAAPVQATWLGYPNTTGLSAVDYRITDAICDPPGDSESLHVESLLRLPGAQWCYTAPLQSPDVAPLPALANGHVTFGAFNNSAKISADTVAAWTDLLVAVPDSRILLWGLPQELAGRLRERLASRGIAEARVRCVGRTGFAEQLALVASVDIALDTYPYSGVTTSFNSLWMGVPVLGARGPAIASRSTHSIMGALGLADWIAPSPAALPALGAAKSADLDALAQLRASLRSRLQDSSLMDGPDFARKFESTLADA